ncbi:hypothetical protein EVAR_77003_1 [Eumeta japonica]|uniref:Uncharacterized protein n=1 Tax=Eumeta variegata TaxID=151549 RepID=A0A4C1SFD3_EUMVA|nr:hypothetical protein EVAR_77003_1 [Eumeta japonica]
MNDSVTKRSMKVNIGETNVMVFERGESTTEYDILIEGEKVEQEKEFVYFGSLFTNDGEHNTDVEKKVNTGNKVKGALFAFMNSKSVSRQVHLAIHNGIIIPILMNGNESWRKSYEVLGQTAIVSQCRTTASHAPRSVPRHVKNSNSAPRSGYAMYHF